MLLLENVTNRNGGHGSRNVSLTHTIDAGGDRNHHIRIYEPKPEAGPFAGKLIADYVLDERQAAELKAHL